MFCVFVVVPSPANVVTIRNEDYGHASTSNNGETTSTRWQTDTVVASTSATTDPTNNCDYEEQCSVAVASSSSSSHLAKRSLPTTTTTTYLSESESDYEYNNYYRTPSPSPNNRNKRRYCSGGGVMTADSGYSGGSGPCSSNGNSYSLRNRRSNCNNNGYSNGHSSDEEYYSYVSFKKRVKKAKLNIRKHIGADSDSN